MFLSYAKEDRALAERVVAGLRREGFSVWWDDDLTPHERWDAIIETELEAAEMVLVLWTPVSIQRDWVKSEADVALQCDPPKLVQVRFDRCRVPLGFNRRQYLDLDVAAPERSATWPKLLQWLRIREPTPASPAETAEMPRAAAPPPRNPANPTGTITASVRAMPAQAPASNDSSSPDKGKSDLISILVGIGTVIGMVIARYYF